MNDPKVKLLLCGQPEAESHQLQELGKRKLQNRITWLTLPPDEVKNVLAASDVFVLPSLTEGLAAVLVEAALCPLPIIAHPHAGSSFILQDDPYWLTDLSAPGGLLKRLVEFRNNPPGEERLKVLKSQAVHRFSDKLLAPKFVTMMKRAASLN